MKRPVNQRVVRVKAKSISRQSLQAKHLFILLTGLFLILCMQATQAAFSRVTENNPGIISHSENHNALYHRMRAIGTDAFEKGEFEYAAATLTPLAYADDAESQYYLGVMYDNGVGVELDQVMAVHWYRRAAELGHSDAQYNIGIAYSRGEGVGRNLAQALYWWEQAGMQGNLNALFNLGVAYSTGRGTGRDFGQAIHWWTQAAKLGDSIAQYNLGAVYANGVGVNVDLQLAAKWWHMSAKQGNDQAKAALQILQSQLQ